MDVDIAVGEGQPLGIPMQFGGPYLGLFAAKAKFMRKMPGRLVGQTVDVEGKRAFCLTLQTREQHIRREKATSNVCTNQGLLALRASVYMAAMGPQGLRQAAQLCFNKTTYLAQKLAAAGLSLRFGSQPFFNELLVRLNSAGRRGGRRFYGRLRDRPRLSGIGRLPAGRRDRTAHQR
jgi:glycine dehydrogenase subunit 1